MSTAATALARYSDPVTRRIYQEIARKGKAISLVMQMAGFEQTTWLRRATRGNWRTKELQRIATVLDVSFPWLVDALNQEERAGAA